MIVKELISEGLLPVKRSDTVGDALSLAIQGELRHLPVVDEDRKLIGMIRLATLLNEGDVARPIGELPFDAPISVPEDAHVYDAIQLVVEQSVEVLPVVSHDGTYTGSIGLANVLEPIARMLAVPEGGSVIELEMSSRDYTLRHVVHAIEESGARILSLGSERSAEGDDTVTVTVKVSVEDTSRIMAVLEHLGYRVNRSTGRELDDEELQHRVAEFMHYLDV